MDHREEVRLLSRCLEWQAQRGTQLAEGEGAASVDRYLDARRFELELECIFRRLPTALLHASELDEKHAFATRALGHDSLLFTRDAEGRIGTFRNVCRHRGTRLVDAAAGCAERFTCPYHGWTYAASGELVGVPHGDSCFPNLRREDSGLAPVKAAERFGLVWVNADAPELERQWHGMETDLTWLGLESLRPFAVERRIWQTNWKLVAEGGLETYHFRHAHRGTIGSYFYDNLSLWDRFGNHFRTVMPKRSLESLRQQPESTWSLREHTHITYYLFPATILLVQPDHVVWIQVQPLAHDLSDISLATLVPGPGAPHSEKPDAYWRKNHDITCGTLREDFALAESIQSGLASGANRQLRFGRNEGALTEFQRVVDSCLQEA